jgi:hypothetical protein
MTTQLDMERERKKIRFCVKIQKNTPGDNCEANSGTFFTLRNVSIFFFYGGVSFVS